VLITLRRAAVWLPGLELAVAAVFALGIAMDLRRPTGPDWEGLAWIGGFTALLLVYCASRVRHFARHEDGVRVRGLFSSLELGADVAAGFITRSLGRSAILVVYLTDGRAKHDAIHLSPFGTRRAERLVAKLTTALELRPSAVASPAVRADRDMLAEANRQVSSYYATPAFRGAVGVGLALVLVYVVAMAIFVVLNEG